MAAIGFALIDLFNRSERFSLKMSPYFVAFTAFCFSMTVGVVWEFFEFGMDWFFHTDMQKDWILPAISSVKLDPAGANNPVRVTVESVVVNGEEWNFGGYLDIGIVDTMKDREFYRSHCFFCYWNYIFEATGRREAGCCSNSPNKRQVKR